MNQIVLDQVIKECCKEVIKQFILCLIKQNKHFIRLAIFARILSDQGSFLKVTKVNFVNHHLGPGCKWFYRPYESDYSYRLCVKCY